MTIRSHYRILLTGAAGGLGQAMRPRLKANCQILRSADRVAFGLVNEKEKQEKLEGSEEFVLAELADADAVMAMMQEVDAVVHLGGVSTEAAFEPILQANIIGMYNLYEAARKQGVKRIVFASSNHVTGYYKQSETIHAAHPPRPDGLYGVSKAFGEDLSRFYFDRYGIETACVRIGSSFEEIAACWRLG
jgi:uronate dehydrogenase